MPRRMITSEIFRNEKFGGLNDASRLLFIGLFSNADDDGRLKGSARFLKALIFPYDQKSVKSIELLTEYCASAGLVQKYNVNGCEYISVVGFKEHQIIRSDRYKSSNLPPPPDNQATTKRQPSDNQATPQSNIIESNIIKDNKVQRLPDFIDKEIWNDFLEMRKKMRKPPTDKAVSLLLEDLGKFKIAGDDPNEVLKQSIKNNWMGVFSLKGRGGQGGAHKQSSRKLPTQYHSPGETFGSKHG